MAHHSVMNSRDLSHALSATPGRNVISGPHIPAAFLHRNFSHQHNPYTLVSTTTAPHITPMTHHPMTVLPEENLQDEKRLGIPLATYVVDESDEEVEDDDIPSAVTVEHDQHASDNSPDQSIWCNNNNTLNKPQVLTASASSRCVPYLSSHPHHINNSQPLSSHTLHAAAPPRVRRPTSVYAQNMLPQNQTVYDASNTLHGRVDLVGRPALPRPMLFSEGGHANAVTSSRVMEAPTPINNRLEINVRPSVVPAYTSYNNIISQLPSPSQRNKAVLRSPNVIYEMQDVSVRPQALNSSYAHSAQGPYTHANPPQYVNFTHQQPSNFVPMPNTLDLASMVRERERLELLKEELILKEEALKKREADLNNRMGSRGNSVLFSDVSGMLPSKEPKHSFHADLAAEWTVDDDTEDVHDPQACGPWRSTALPHDSPQLSSHQPYEHQSSTVNKQQTIDVKPAMLSSASSPLWEGDYVPSINPASIVRTYGKKTPKCLKTKTQKNKPVSFKSLRLTDCETVLNGDTSVTIIPVKNDNLDSKADILPKVTKINLESTNIKNTNIIKSMKTDSKCFNLFESPSETSSNLISNISLQRSNSRRDSKDDILPDDERTATHSNVHAGATRNITTAPHESRPFIASQLSSQSLYSSARVAGHFEVKPSIRSALKNNNCQLKLASSPSDSLFPRSLSLNVSQNNNTTFERTSYKSFEHGTSLHNPAAPETRPIVIDQNRHVVPDIMALNSNQSISYHKLPMREPPDTAIITHSTSPSKSVVPMTLNKDFKIISRQESFVVNKLDEATKFGFHPAKVHTKQKEILSDSEFSASYNDIQLSSAKNHLLQSTCVLTSPETTNLPSSQAVIPQKTSIPILYVQNSQAILSSKAVDTNGRIALTSSLSGSAVSNPSTVSPREAQEISQQIDKNAPKEAKDVLPHYVNAPHFTSSASSSDDEMMSGVDVEGLVKSLSSPTTASPPPPSVCNVQSIHFSPVHTNSNNVPGKMAVRFLPVSVGMSPSSRTVLYNSDHSFHEDVPVNEAAEVSLSVPPKDQFSLLFTSTNNVHPSINKSVSGGLIESHQNDSRLSIDSSKDNNTSVADASDVLIPSDDELRDVSYHNNTADDEVFEDDTALDAEETFTCESQEEQQTGDVEPPQQHQSDMLDCSTNNDMSTLEDEHATTPGKRKKMGSPRKSKKKRCRRSKGGNSFRAKIGKFAAPKFVGKIICGVCDDDVVYIDNKFLDHINKAHNGLARPLGESQEFNADEEKRAYNITLSCGSRLVCHKCRMYFKSSLGYVQHNKYCGLSESERTRLCPKCGFCGTVFTIAIHMRNCNKAEVETVNTPVVTQSGRPQRKAKANSKRKLLESLGNDDGDISCDDELNDESYDHTLDDDYDDDELEEETDVRENISSNNKGRYLTSSTDRFSQVLEKSIMLEVPASTIDSWNAALEDRDYELKCHYYPECDVTASTVQEITSHSLLCHLRCTLCNKNESRLYTSEEVVPHLTSNHSNEFKEICAAEKQKKSFVRKFKKFHVPDTESPYVTELIQEICPKDEFFTDFPVNLDEWLMVDDPTLYFPRKQNSIPFQFSVGDDRSEWEQLSFGESKQAESGVFMFCGGAVTVCDWCPHSSANNYEYVALVAANDMPKKEEVQQKGVIQFWNFGSLSAEEEMLAVPNVEFFLGYSDGTINSLAWCPLDLSDDVRLGALAVAASMSSVHIYIIPQPHLLNASNSSVYLKSPDISLEQTPAFDEPASVVLTLKWFNSESGMSVVCTTEEGSVIIWDLKKCHTLRSNKRLYPRQIVRCHKGTTLGLSCNMNPTCNVIATGGHDRVHSLWDFKKTPHCVSVARREIVYDTVFGMNTTSSVVSFDNVSLRGTCSTAVRECEFSGLSMMYVKTNGISFKLAVSKFSDAIAQVSDNGSCSVTMFRDLHRINYDKGGRYQVFNYEVENVKIEDNKTGLRFMLRPSVTKISREHYVGDVSENNKLSSKGSLPTENEHSNDDNLKYMKNCQVLASRAVVFSPNFRTRNWVFLGYDCGLGRLIRLPSTDGFS